MEKMTDIARDYLADFDVLTEARTELEDQLDKWWRVLLPEFVQPALQKLNGGAAPHEWDNKASPGQCQYRVAASHPMILQLTDPRSSRRGCYTLTLMAQTQPALKTMSKNEALAGRLSALARELGVGDASGLNWARTELACTDIPIWTDDPDGTLRQVRDAADRLFSVAVEHRRLTGKDEAVTPDKP